MPTSAPVLLATDFSEAADHAASFAVQAARSRHTPLHIVTAHVVSSAVPDMTNRLYQADAKLLEDYNPAPDLKPIKHLLQGTAAAPLIVNYARENNVGLIAIGSHDQQRLEHFFLGSVAAEVVRTAPVSVLVASPHQSASPDSYQCILAPVDFSEPSLEALHEAAAIASQNNARLLVVHCVDTSAFPTPWETSSDQLSEQARDRLDEVVESLTVPEHIEPVVTEGRVHTRLADLSDEYNADMIVMGASGRGGVQQLLLGSVTSRVLRMTSCAVLVQRGEARDLPESSD